MLSENGLSLFVALNNNKINEKISSSNGMTYCSSSDMFWMFQSISCGIWNMKLNETNGFLGNPFLFSILYTWKHIREKFLLWNSFRKKQNSHLEFYKVWSFFVRQKAILKNKQTTLTCFERKSPAKIKKKKKHLAKFDNIFSLVTLTLKKDFCVSFQHAWTLNISIKSDFFERKWEKSC